MAESKYSVGIDLGTTNCSVAWIDRLDLEKKINFLPIPQLISEGEMADKFLLPSFVFIPGSFEISEGALSLPWTSSQNYAVGELARKRSVTSPSRVVSSAKSWLCHCRVDRHAPILPWGSNDELEKISPLEAIYRILLHLKNAWNYKMALDNPENTLDKQELVVTVPASFDETARELVGEALKRCDLINFALLEEPQAAFYSWLCTRESYWKRELDSISGVLVCDVGGGTTDFSLFTFDKDEEGMSLKRAAVGDHLLLGGDNMDMSLAYTVEKRLGRQSKIDSVMWSSLCQECRQAKEALLSDNPPEKVNVTVLGRGSRLIGSSLQSELRSEDIKLSILDGFFGDTAYSESVSSASSSALAEWGLPYEKDPSVSRHIASFLKTHIKGEQIPDAVMFNGGVFTPQIIRDRVHRLLEKWRGSPVRILENLSLDLAVSAGAAYFGLVRRGEGIRIGGGIPRSYYVKLESGEEDSYLCLIPKDLMTETPVEIKEHNFSVMLNRPVSFSVFSSNKRFDDNAGSVLSIRREELLSLPALATVMKSSAKDRIKDVYLRSWISEIGTLEVWCVARDENEKWRLSFSLDRCEETVEPNNEKSAPVCKAVSLANNSKIRECILQAFNKSDTSVKPKGLFTAIEEIAGCRRENFSVGMSRNIFDIMSEFINKRRMDERTEGVWFNIAGYTLRPGFGAVLDEWRMEKVSEILGKWLQHNKDSFARLEWWIFWRRCAGGMSAEDQEFLFARISPWLFPGQKHLKTFSGPLPSKTETIEILRTAASLEKISTGSKIQLAEYILENIERKKGNESLYFWCLARIGARIPVSAPVNYAVPGESAAKWARRIIELNMAGENALMAISRLCTLTGDRYRDIDEALRKEALAFLKEHAACESYIKPVTEITETEMMDSALIYGESLPPGLILTRH